MKNNFVGGNNMEKYDIKDCHVRINLSMIVKIYEHGEGVFHTVNIRLGPIKTTKLSLDPPTPMNEFKLRPYLENTLSSYAFGIMEKIGYPGRIPVAIDEHPVYNRRKLKSIGVKTE